MQTVFAWTAQYGYPALFIFLMLGLVCLPIPDETLLTFCGYLIYTGRLHFGLTFLAGFLGSVFGISISFVFGLRFGKLFLHRFGRFIHLTPDRVLKVEKQFQRFGPCLLMAGYFLPGLRHFTAIVAGTTGLRWSRFALFAYLGAALWIATFLTLGYVFGERWQHTSDLAHRYLLIAAAIALVIVLFVWFLRKRRGSS